MLKKLFPFLFKEKVAPAKEGPKSSSNGHSRNQKSSNGSSSSPDQTSEANYFGLIARNRNNRGLRKGSKVYVRQVYDDNERLRVRGTAPNGKKVTLTVHRKALKDFESEPIPEHIEKHYREDSMYSDEHEAKVKAEVFNKR